MTSVLVVEDNDELRVATVQFLVRHDVYASGVTCAEEVDEFTDAISPQIYLIDLGLPGEDGLSLAKRIRAAQPRAGIVMLTARSSIEARVSGYEHGADVYLPKPADPEELLAVVRSLSQRLAHEVSPEASLQVHARKLLLIGPKLEQRLTQRECLLLSALARANDHLLERWQILQLLDPTYEGVSTDSMEVCIVQLRKKLTACSGLEHPKNGVIKAVRGVGYRLLVPVQIL